MSWSPDGEWLSYTVVTNPEPDELRPGWIFLTSNSAAETSGKQPAPSGGAAGPIHRIWATHRDHQPSVLIEESHWPLTAPAWSPRGKSVAFGRFVPQSIEPAQSVQRGRYEVVIQDGLERKHIVWSSPDFELDPLARASLPHLSCSWSPDGLYLAIPRPGRQARGRDRAHRYHEAIACHRGCHPTGVVPGRIQMRPSSAARTIPAAWSTSLAGARISATRRRSPRTGRSPPPRTGAATAARSSRSSREWAPGRPSLKSFASFWSP